MKEEVIHRLLDGIRRYGLENISVLSKYTGIPVETARYMIWEELPKYFIIPHISINLESLGLYRFRLEIQPARKENAGFLERALKRGTGLMFSARSVPENSLFCFMGIPMGQEDELEEQLSRLKGQGAISSYSLERVEWLRHLSFNARFYDLKKRQWSFDWGQVSKFREPLLTPLAKKSDSPKDYKDLLILNAMREKIPRTLSQLSRSLALGQHNLRYHYRNHASDAVQGTYLEMTSRESESSLVPFIFVNEPSSKRTLARLREIAVSIPFTRLTWKAKMEYGWFVYCPSEYVNGLLHFVNEKLEKTPGKTRMILCDAKHEFNRSIPMELYDEKTESWTYKPRLLDSRT